MARYLTGIQSSGKPHLGNLLGAILPAIEHSRKQPEPGFFFIADLHTLTSSRNAEVNRGNAQAVAAAWLACGLDTNQHVFWRQSDVPEVAELAWYLGCVAPFPMLANAHSFKDKSENLPEVNAGLFTYPVLMAADILLYDGELVPVGKDQKQHLEMTRDIASSFNHQMGRDVLVLPDAVIDDAVMTIPGIDGRKMSKSYKNTIDVFAPEKELRKTCMSIVTDSTPLEEPKNPDTDAVFALYSVVANQEQVSELRKLYLGGNFGYGTAKQMLFEAILHRFAEARSRHAELMQHPQQIEQALLAGAAKARAVATPTLHRVREALGLRVA